jgi:hypothetical protein
MTLDVRDLQHAQEIIDVLQESYRTLVLEKW